MIHHSASPCGEAKLAAGQQEYNLALNTRALSETFKGAAEVRL